MHLAEFKWSICGSLNHFHFIKFMYFKCFEMLFLMSRKLPYQLK